MADRTFNTFIFDIDGTLLDTVDDLALLTNRILEEVGCPTHTTPEILSYVGAGVRRLIYLALPEDASEETVDKAVDLWNQYFAEYYHETHPFPDIEELLEQIRLRGGKVGAVSNKLQAGVDLIMAKCLPGKVDIMFGESPSVPRKPDPKGIQLAMAHLGAAPEESVYVGDSPTDVVAAKNAGAFSVVVLWGYHRREDFGGESEPDLFVDAPLELLSLIPPADAHLQDGITGAALS